MRASSDTIAQLAAAMAKAQSELVNPPKSLTAVLEHQWERRKELSLCATICAARHRAKEPRQIRACADPNDPCRSRAVARAFDEDDCAWIGRVDQWLVAGLRDGRSRLS